MQQEHPFAPIIRILGKGKNGSRALTQEQAYQAMKMILAGQVLPEQLGAFLMLMRIKEEEPEELAGMVRAARDSMAIPANAPAVDLDWSSYAGKRRHLPWFLLSTFLLAENGTRIFMHGTSGHTDGRIYTKDIVSIFGLPVCTHLEQACEQMQMHNFAYMDLEHLSPRLHEIIEMRSILGLRSPVHTLARMLNPFNAPYVMQGIFHPGYRPLHQESAQLLDMRNLAVIKGEGGEIERNPDTPCLVQSVRNGELSDQQWPAIFARRHVRDEDLNIHRLLAVWDGSDDDEYGVGAIIGTVAIALHLMGKAGTIESAGAQARRLWDTRQRQRFSAVA